MKQRTAQWWWFGGSYVGVMLARGLTRYGYPVASVVAAGATGVWFLAWLMRDNFQFRKEVAAQRQSLAERRAAVRAVKDAEAAAIAAARRRADADSSTDPRELS